MSRAYKVFLVDNKTDVPDFSVDADDVNVECNDDGSAAWFNFSRGDDDVTAAAIPFDMLRYVKS